MAFQRTIKSAFEVVGREPYGGCNVEVIFSPLKPESGRIFKTSRGSVDANLENAVCKRSSIHLEKGLVSVAQVEHVLATCLAYGLDNVEIEVKRRPSKSYSFLDKLGLATPTEAFPNFENRQRLICEKLEEVGLVEQNVPRKKLNLEEETYTPNFIMSKTNSSKLIIRCDTNYKIPGKESFEIILNPVNYREEISEARSYVKHVPFFVYENVNEKVFDFFASLVYLNFGFGNGYKNKYFFPCKDIESWKKQEKYAGEIARHSIVDRLGALALLNRDLSNVRVITKFSGHKNDLRILKKHFSSNNNA